MTRLLSVKKTLVLALIISFTFLILTPGISFGQKISPKMKAFLERVDKASSIKDIAEAAKQAQFNKAELQILYDYMGKNNYQEKIKALASRIIKPGEPQPTKPNALNAELNRKLAQKVAALNRKAQSQLQAVSIVQLPPLRKPVSVTPFNSTMQAKMRAYGDSGAATAFISSYTRPARIGRNINIIGDNFGTRRAGL